MVTFTLLIVVHVVPLVLRDAVMVLPLRTRRTHRFGAVPLLLLVVVTLPPTVVRRCQRQAPLSLTVSAAIRELPDRVSRIITPTRELVPVFCRLLTRATIDPSAL